MSMSLLYFMERFASYKREDFPDCIRRADSLAERCFPHSRVQAHRPAPSRSPSARSPAGPSARSWPLFPRCLRIGTAYISWKGRCVCVGWGEADCLEICYGTAAGKRDFVIFRTKGRAGCPRARLLCGSQEPKRGDVEEINKEINK